LTLILGGDYHPLTRREDANSESFEKKPFSAKRKIHRFFFVPFALGDMCDYE